MLQNLMLVFNTQTTYIITQSASSRTHLAKICKSNCNYSCHFIEMYLQKFSVPLFFVSGVTHFLHRKWLTLIMFYTSSKWSCGKVSHSVLIKLPIFIDKRPKTVLWIFVSGVTVSGVTNTWLQHGLNKLFI